MMVGGMALKTLISPDGLFPHLEDPAWLVVDCQFDLDDPEGGYAAYLKGHIPGAVHADLERDLSAPKTGTNGRHPLALTKDLIGFFSKLGIAEGMQVVAYDDFGSAFAARLWWTLRYLGHDTVAVLDGGLRAWTSGGYPLRTEAESRPASTFHASPRPEMLALAEEVEQAVDDPGLLLLDARSPERFRGREETRDPVAGRIPGARNRYWSDNMTPGERFRTPDELRMEFEALLRNTAPANVIAYCGSGVTGCHNLLAMEHAGLGGGRMYAGSWSEWIADPARPIATGEPVEGERIDEREEPE
jgi:thiosulfate/3-mercaptopyruvate sulfurtransferase